MYYVLYIAHVKYFICSRQQNTLDQHTWLVENRDKVNRVWYIFHIGQVLKICRVDTGNRVDMVDKVDRLTRWGEMVDRDGGSKALSRTTKLIGLKELTGVQVCQGITSILFQMSKIYFSNASTGFSCVFF